MQNGTDCIAHLLLAAHFARQGGKQIAAYLKQAFQIQGIYVVVMPPTAVGYIEQRTHRHKRKHRSQCPPIEAGRIIGGSLRAALHLFVHTGGAQ